MLDLSAPLPFVQPLQRDLADFKNIAIPLVVTVSSIGVCSMALVQVIKDQTPWRKRYQQRRVRQWLAEGVAAVNPKLPTDAAPVDWHAVEVDMIRLATDGDAKAFYALEIEKLCGQLNAAAQSAMQDVEEHKPFVAFLASETDQSCLTIVLAGTPKDADVPLPQTDPRMQAYAAARGQVAQQIQRAIDALQLSVGADWATRMQQISLIVSVVIAFLAVWVFGTNALSGSKIWDGVAAIFIGLIGGYIAPVSKDLIAALQKLGE